MPYLLATFDIAGFYYRDRAPFWRNAWMGDEKERKASEERPQRYEHQSSSGASTGIAKPAFTRSITTIVLNPLMSGFS